jgi:hypothetical protein
LVERLPEVCVMVPVGVIELHEAHSALVLHTPQGHALGALCVIDRVPRELSDEQKEKIRPFAQSAMILLEMRLSRPNPRV